MVETTPEDILHRSEAAVGIIYSNGEIILIKRIERKGLVPPAHSQHPSSISSTT